MKRRALLTMTAALASALVAFPASAESVDDLAQKISNPVASLTSVPLQLNWDTGLGAGGNGERTTLNVQPVIPVALGSNWNLISRTIVPIIQQSDVLPGDRRQSGLGDVLQSAFFSPKQPTANGWIWGAGPALLMPTGSREFSADEWAAGPTAVVLKQTPTGWTYGFLANHLWGFAGGDAAVDVDATFVQPFVSKAIAGGRTVSVNAEATYDWTGTGWTVPVNASYSQVMTLGGQLVSIGGGVRWYASAPSGGPEWGARVVITLLFPR